MNMRREIPVLMLTVAYLIQLLLSVYLSFNNEKLKDKIAMLENNMMACNGVKESK